MISIRMPNLYGDSVLPPSELLFKSCLESRMFPSEWKKTHVVLVHKSFGKHSLNIYHPIALLFICQKIFQRLMCHKIFLYFIGNNLISYNQSRFKPRDSCINHLLCIIYEIYYLLMRTMKLEKYFLTYRKPWIRFGSRFSFINVKNGTLGSLLNIATDFSYQLKQKVLLNGQYS